MVADSNYVAYLIPILETRMDGLESRLTGDRARLLRSVTEAAAETVDRSDVQIGYFRADRKAIGFPTNSDRELKLVESLIGQQGMNLPLFVGRLDPLVIRLSLPSDLESAKSLLNRITAEYFAAIERQLGVATPAADGRARKCPAY